jgi:hypothetical protein
MIDKIGDSYHSADFDFRMFTYESEEFTYLFEERVLYYRMKYANLKSLGQKTILESGPGKTRIISITHIFSPRELFFV